MIAKRIPTKERLLAKVKIDPPTGCWQWTGAKTGAGYGAISHNRKLESVHRVSYELFVGSIQDGLFVCHRCDNRLCANPAHLFLGTQAQNISDKTAKERQARGESHGCAKLTEADVRAIRSSIDAPAKALAEIYGVHFATIYAIRQGKKWNHLGRGNA